MVLVLVCDNELIELQLMEVENVHTSRTGSPSCGTNFHLIVKEINNHRTFLHMGVRVKD